MRVNHPVTDSEVKFPNHYNLLSTTDIHGKIKYASNEFCEVAGYSYEELYGQPHNLVRHPTMPSIVFKNMWNFIGDGRTWMGLVKNRAKNGDYYWVNAFASPIKIDGTIVEYQSVRTVPDEKSIDRASKLYKKIFKKKRLPLFTHFRTKLWQRSILGFAVGAIAAFFVSHHFDLTSAVICQFLFAVFTIYIQTRHLNSVTKLARKAYDNPLMEYIYNGRTNDISEIELALKMRGSELNAVVSRIMDSSDQVLSAANLAKTNGQKTAENLLKQTQETEIVATAMNEMSVTANDISSNAQEASLSAVEANNSATSGLASVEKTLNSIQHLMQQLNQASQIITELETYGKHIDKVSNVIEDIAEQTNLLALNAAIESARAGEQGRGFSVVSSEVRRLAQKTQESTTEIQTIISKIQLGTQDAVAAMAQGTNLSQECMQCAEQAGEVLQHSQSLVNNINDQNHQIATAIQEQATVISELNSTIQSIANLSQESIDIAERSVTEAEHLYDALDNQTQLVKQFRRIG